MAMKTFNIKATIDEEDIEHFCSALRGLERQYNDRFRFRMTSIEDRLLEELQNCIKYEGYKVCVFTSNENEKHDIEEKVYNLLKDIDFSLNQCSEHDKRYGRLFDNGSRFMVCDAQRWAKSSACGMRFNTVICYNVDRDTSDFLYQKFLTLAHPEAKRYMRYMIYTR